MPFSCVVLLFPFFMSSSFSSCQSAFDFLIKVSVTGVAWSPVTCLICSSWHPIELFISPSCSLELPASLFHVFGLNLYIYIQQCEVFRSCEQLLCNDLPPPAESWEATEQPNASPHRADHVICLIGMVLRWLRLHPSTRATTEFVHHGMSCVLCMHSALSTALLETLLNPPKK